MSREDANQLKVFAGRHAVPLAKRICEFLDIPLGQARTDEFPDSELIVKLEEDVRGRDCYVVLSTCQPVNDNLVELLVFLDCLKRASANRVTCVMPYFGYARQDRKDEGRVPITAKLVANLLTAARADRIIAIDLHAAQVQGFFDIPLDHLTATPVFIRHFESMREQLGDLCLVSPDVGNVKVAEGIANLLGGDLAIINKRRKSGSEVVSAGLIGSVRNKTVLMFDDMISTAGTICEAARVVMDNGARDVIAAATHGVLVGMAQQRLLSSPISRLFVTNTIPMGPRVAALEPKLTELCVGELLANAIHRIHHNMSVSALFKNGAGPKR
jgi:ribose-phosphate pyrophosphokinase